MQILQVSEKESGKFHPSHIHPLKWMLLFPDSEWVRWGDFSDKVPDVIIIHAVNQRPHLVKVYKSVYPEAFIVGLSYNQLWLTNTVANSTNRAGTEKIQEAFEICNLVFGRVSPGVMVPPTINWRDMVPFVDDTVFKIPAEENRKIAIFQARGLSDRAVYWPDQKNQVLSKWSKVVAVHKVSGRMDSKEMADVFRMSKVALAFRVDSGPSYTALESILCGCIPIISTAPVMRSLFYDGKGVRLVNKNIREIDSAIKSVLNLSPEEHQEESMIARSKISDYALGVEGSRIREIILTEVGPKGVEYLQSCEPLLPISRRMRCDPNSTDEERAWPYSVKRHNNSPSADGLHLPGICPSRRAATGGPSDFDIRCSDRRLVNVCRDRGDVITVCIPTYNRAQWVLQAIQSVVDQTVRNWEILIYDDGSTDNTSEVIQDYMSLLPESVRRKVTYKLSPQNQGNGYVRAWYKHNVDTDWSCWQDSDDYSHPDRLYKQINAVNNHKLDCCFSWLRRFRGNRVGLIKRIRVPDYSRDVWSLSGNINSPTGFMNERARGVIPETPIDHGGYDTVWISGMICSGMTIGCVNAPLYYLRQHDGRIVARKTNPTYQAPRQIERVLIWDILDGLGMTNLKERPCSTI